MDYIIISIIVFIILYVLLWNPKKPAAAVHADPAMNGKLLRGTKVLGTAAAAEIVVKYGGPLGATLAGIPIPKKVETTNFLFQGAPGAGKSLAFIQMLSYAREAGHRAVVIDNNSDFLRRFYRPGDVIINPFDSRSEAWSPLSEMAQPYDAMRLAQSIAPDGIGENKVWSTYSQILISAVLQRLWERGGVSATNAELSRLLTVAPVGELRDVCAGLPASTLLEEGAERMFASIRADVGARMAAFAYLSPQAGEDAFSLTKFVRQDGNGWVFLTYRDDQFAMLKSMIAAQLDVLISATLSLAPSDTRRIFFAMDEMATLGKIQSVESLLTKGRKFGASAIIGLQTISQFRNAYGTDQTQTLLSCLGTWLCLRSPDPDTAEMISKFLGKQEILRTMQSYGGSAESGTGWSQQIMQTETVMPTTLQKLNDRYGYLNIVGSFHPAGVKVPYPPSFTEAAPAFVDRDFKAEARAEAAARKAVAAEAITMEHDKVLELSKGLL